MIVIHRINDLEALSKIPLKYGIEIDVREDQENLLLSHDRIQSGKSYCNLEDYLKDFEHPLAVFNIKTTGIENQVIEIAQKYALNNYFLLDVEFPFFYRATRKDKFRNMAIRFSEAEPLEFVNSQIIHGKPLVDWVWIDTNTILPLNVNNIPILKKFNTCLVCPERWGRPEDISNYMDQMNRLKFKPTSVMTSMKFASVWERFYD